MPWGYVTLLEDCFLIGKPGSLGGILRSEKAQKLGHAGWLAIDQVILHHHVLIVLNSLHLDLAQLDLGELI